MQYHMQDWRFLHCQCWGFRCSGLLCWVAGLLFSQHFEGMYNLHFRQWRSLRRMHSSRTPWPLNIKEVRSSNGLESVGPLLRILPGRPESFILSHPTKLVYSINFCVGCGFHGAWGSTYRLHLITCKHCQVSFVLTWRNSYTLISQIYLFYL